jgi:hypothetical protein
MLLGGRRMQRPIIDRSGEGNGRPVQERQDSGRQRSTLGDGTRQQKCQRTHDGGGQQIMWNADDAAANNTTTNHHREHQQRAGVGDQSSRQRLEGKTVAGGD